MSLTKTSLLRAATLVCIVLALAPLYGQINPEWTAPQKPFRIAGNLYYVGSRDLASYLIVTPAGNILINGNLKTSPPQIRASVEALGFRWADTKILLNGQAHFDHSAGNAAILRETGARLMVMDADASTMESGGRDDFDHLPQFPPAHVSRILHDGSAVTLGGVTLVAHKTAGHTRGCTTWTMQVKDDRGRVLNVVIVGGFAALDSYRLVSTPGHPASYPGIARDFKHTFATLKSLPCDIFLGAHGSYFDMQQKLKEPGRRGDSRWIDPAGYRSMVNEAQQAFEHRLKQQQEAAH